MAPQLILRPQVYEDIPKTNIVGKFAFGDNAQKRAIWKNATEEEKAMYMDAWYEGRARAYFGVPGQHCIVAVYRDDETGAEEVVGFANWQQPLTEVDPSAGKTDEQKAAEKAALRATWPTCIDLAVVDAFGANCQRAINEHIGEEEARGMWTPTVVAVHPNHQRKGIATMLLRWGLDKAKESGTDAYVIASQVGRKAYLTLGFEDLTIFRPTIDEAYLMRWRNSSR